MILALLLALQMPVNLPPALEEWKSEIEARTFQRIEIVRVPGDPIPAEDQDVLFQYFAKPDFAASFQQSQAITFRYERGGKSRSLILLNAPRIQTTHNSVAALLTHELGHIWLASLGLLPPVYEPGPRACLAIHTGDIVQHMLMRAESDRRGIPWRPSYERDYTAAADSLRGAPESGAGDDCLRAQRLSLMLDVRTGFEPKSFAAREEYLDALGRQDPVAEAISIELMEELSGRVSLDPAEYRWALDRAQSAVERLLSP